MCSVNLGLAGVYKYKSSQKNHLNISCYGDIQELALLVTLGIPKCRGCFSWGEKRKLYKRMQRLLGLSMTFNYPT